MADDPNSTKAAFDDKNWVFATESGEYLTQKYCGDWTLAPAIIQEALNGGCSAVLLVQDQFGIPPKGFWLPPDRLRWVNALNPSMRRENFPDRSWPWELRAYLLPSERPTGESTLPVLLRRAEAVQWGLLLPAQAVASEDQLNGIHAQNAPEQLEAKTVLPPSAPDAAQTLDAKVESGDSQRIEPGLPSPKLCVPHPRELRKWPPKEVPVWFSKIRETYSKERGEGKRAYAIRLHGYMKNDFEEPPWDAESIRRRLNDPGYDRTGQG